MKLIKILFLLLLIIPLVSLASAATNMTFLHGVALTTPGTNGDYHGMRILTFDNLTLIAVARQNGVTATTAYLWNDSNTVLASAAFGGNDIAYFNYNLSNATYYRIVAGSGGAAKTDYVSASAAPYPIKTGQINWTDGIANSALHTFAWDIFNITVQNLTFPNNSLSVNLISPPNNTQVITVGTNFSANYTSRNYNFTNASYYVWNSNGSLFNRSTVSVTGNVTNSSILFIDDFVFGNYYLWNVLLCGVNNTGTLCVFSNENNSFQSVPFTINNVSYTNNTFETKNERFSLVIASSNVLSATALLNYNGSFYTSTGSCSSTTCTFTNQLDIPLVTGGMQNKTFFWNISVFSGSSITSYLTQTYIQTVNQTNLSVCNSGTIAMNFTAWDEQNQTRLLPFDFQGSFDYYLGGGSIYKTVNLSNSSVNEVNLCVSSNQTYRTNAIIAYSRPDYPTRNFFFQNYSFDNTTQKIPLYLLRSGSSTSFILQVQDNALLPVPSVLVEAQRCYPGTNTNQTVFKSRTDANGMTTGNLEAETALYQFFITNNSRTLLSVTPCAKVIPQTVPYTLLFTLGSAYVSPFTSIDNLSDIDETLFFNYTNNILTLTYIDHSGNFTGADLIVRSMNFSGASQPIVCHQVSNLSSSIMTCNISTAGTYTGAAYIYRNGQVLLDQITFTVQTFSSDAGHYGVFLGFFIILICAFAFKYNEIAGIWLINVAVIFVNYIGMIAFGKVFITAMLCVSLIITVVLER